MSRDSANRNFDDRPAAFYHMARGFRLSQEIARPCRAALIGEVVGVKPGGRPYVLPFGGLEAACARGARSAAFMTGRRRSLRPSAAWLGRVVNGLSARPIDGKGPLAAERGRDMQALRASPAAGAVLAGAILASGSISACKAPSTLHAMASSRAAPRRFFPRAGVGKSALLWAWWRATCRL